MGQKKYTGVCIKLNMGCLKRIVEMYEIHYGIFKEEVKDRNEGGLEVTSGGWKRERGLKSLVVYKQSVGQWTCPKKSSA